MEKDIQQKQERWKKTSSTTRGCQVVSVFYTPFVVEARGGLWTAHSLKILKTIAFHNNITISQSIDYFNTSTVLLQYNAKLILFRLSLDASDIFTSLDDLARLSLFGWCQYMFNCLRFELHMVGTCIQLAHPGIM